MTINENFILRQIAGEWVVLAVNTTVVNFNGMLKLNESGVVLWKKLEQGSDRNGLIAALTAEYDVDATVAGADVDAFLAHLRNAGCLID